MGRKHARSVILTFSGGEAEEPEFTPSVRFKVEVYLPILDKLHAELKKRLQACAKLSHNFGFFRRRTSPLSTIFQGKESTDKEDVSDDLEEAASVELQMYGIVAKRNTREVFPNVEIALRIYLTLMVSNCSGERSFSTLKRIKNVLRSTMTDQKLNNLSPMCIEAEVYAKSTSRILLKSLRLVNAANQSCRLYIDVN